MDIIPQNKTSPFKKLENLKINLIIPSFREVSSNFPELFMHVAKDIHMYLKQWCPFFTHNLT